MPHARYTPIFRGLALADSDSCQAAADDASAKLDAQMATVAHAWKVKNFYRPDAMAALTQKTFEILDDAYNHYLQYIAQNLYSAKNSGLTGTGILEKRKAGKVFVDAVASAKASGVDVIDSAGFEKWVLYSLGEASAMYANTAEQACDQQWWVSALNQVVANLEIVAQLVVDLVEVIIKAGELVLKIPDFLSEVVTVLKWTAIVGGAGFALWLLHGLHKSEPAHRAALDEDDDG